MTTQEPKIQLPTAEPGRNNEPSEAVRKALAHPTIEEALTDAYMWPCGD